MEHILNFSAADLCRLLTAPRETLSPLEQKMRDAIEKEYGADHARALGERACLDESTPQAADEKTSKHPIILIRTL